MFMLGLLVLQCTSELHPWHASSCFVLPSTASQGTQGTMADFVFTSDMVEQELAVPKVEALQTPRTNETWQKTTGKTKEIFFSLGE